MGPCSSTVKFSLVQFPFQLFLALISIMRPVSIHLAKGCYRQDPKTLPCQKCSNKNAFWQTQAVSRHTSDMSIHIPVYGNIESDLSRTDKATSWQKPEGPVFLSKRCFHTSHAGITREDCWCLGRAQESDGCCLQMPERAAKNNQGNITAEWGRNANIFRNILNKLSPVSWFKWTPTGLRGAGVLWPWPGKEGTFCIKGLKASDLSLQVVQYLLAQHQHGNRIIGFERLFPWSGLYPLKKIEQLNIFFFLKRINRLWTVTLVARCITRDFHLLKCIVSG